MTILTIDEMGRVRLPDAIRQLLGLKSAAQLTVAIQDGKIVLEPILQSPEVAYEGTVLVVQADLAAPLEPVEQLREERIQEQMTW